MSFFYYQIGPIDWGWANLKTVEETALELGAHDVRERFSPEPTLACPTLEHFMGRWSDAQELASQRGWEGDFRNDPAVFWIPHETDFKCGFVFKQDNNGTTFVLSPIEMKHLEEL